MTPELRDTLTAYTEYKGTPKPPLTLAVPVDYFAQNPETSEGDFISFLIKRLPIPIPIASDTLTTKPAKTTLIKAEALHWPNELNGHIPIGVCGPAVFTAHYDPFTPLPSCIHPHNQQTVLVTYQKYREFKQAWETTYEYKPGTTNVDIASVPPRQKAEWILWQQQQGGHEPEVAPLLEAIVNGNHALKLPADWDTWYAAKDNNHTMAPLLHRGFLQHTAVGEKFLKQIQGFINYWNDTNVMQICHVDHIDHWQHLDNLSDRLRENGIILQIFKIAARDYQAYEDIAIQQRLRASTTNTTEQTDDSPIEAGDLEVIDPQRLSLEVDKEEGQINIGNLFQSVIFQGVQNVASDIHIEPMERNYQIRLCINGVLAPWFQGLSKNTGRALVNLIKVKASLDINERRFPQDGKLRLMIRKTPIEIRVATIPVNDASRNQEEKATLRILTGSGKFASLERVGMEPQHLRYFRSALGMDSGIIIVTGPTGSGKTTTLYAGIQELDRSAMNVVSLEDPIETVIMGVSQTQINPTIEFDFARGLRSLLRMAPNVILVGEIRDPEVAKIATAAANTGHLVLTTLHTNSAALAIPRLIDLGIEPFQMAQSLRLITAQRLLPQLCENCRQTYRPTDDDKDLVRSLSGLELLDQIFTHNPDGCVYCRRGFQGRKMILETIAISKEIRESISQRGKTAEIEEVARKTCNFIPIGEVAITGVNKGIFSLKKALSLITDF